MFKPIGRTAVATVLGLAGLVCGPKASAQNMQYFQLRPGLTVQQHAYNLATIGRALQNVPSYGFGYNPYMGAAGYGAMNPYAGALANPYLAAYSNPYASAYANPYSGGAAGSYGSPYSSGSSGYGGQGSSGYDPFGGELHGEADVTNAQARYLVSQQQAYLLREQYRQGGIATRRKAFDEYLYERTKAPTAEEERQRSLREQVSRSRNDPPVTEVYSGKALNDLLGDLRRRPANKDTTGMPTALMLPDEEGLRHINVTTGRGNPGLFRNEGRLNWPLALRGPEQKELRDPLDELAQEAVSQASFNGRVDPGTVRRLQVAADHLKGELRRSGRDLPAGDYIEANTFLNNFHEALTALQQPGAGNYFNGKYAVKARTVPELVKFMADQGLQFAAALPGDETAYRALHQALAAWDRGAQPDVAGR